MNVEAIRWNGDSVILLDQRLLPLETTFITCKNAQECAEAIRLMVVRGAPAIGITAAYGLALEAKLGGDLTVASKNLLASRPTAVNLKWALERCATIAPENLVEEAKKIHEEDIAINKALGNHGAHLLPENCKVYHHCNTGSLATGGWGTALGVVRSAQEMGKNPHVYIGETRPYLQGARLTAYEMMQEGISCTLVCDNAAAYTLPECDAILVGCDRVAANGDAANKIGTLGLAILAKHFKIPFYVCMPMSTLDLKTPTGNEINIEQRSEEEVRGFGSLTWAPKDVPCSNPAFDVTPANLITGWITENGLWEPEILKNKSSSKENLEKDYEWAAYALSPLLFAGVAYLKKNFI